MIVDNSAEFGVELCLAVPYAYWLHEQEQLEGVITSKGMKPFYYFCNNVEEKYTHRTIDNEQAGLNRLPNNWIHHNATAVFGKGYGDLTEEERMSANGRLDYTKWKLPPYKQKYKPQKSFLDKPIVFITNVYYSKDFNNDRHYHHFTIQGLYDMFIALIAKGYAIIYKRENNTSRGITFDQNDQTDDIIAGVEGFGNFGTSDAIDPTEILLKTIRMNAVLR